MVFIDPVRVDRTTVGRVDLVRDGAEWDATVRFQPEGLEARVHCRARISAVADSPPADLDLTTVAAALTEHDLVSPYSGIVEFGDRFRLVRRHWAEQDRGLVELAVSPDDVEEVANYTLHPALLDRAVYGLTGAPGHSYLPFVYRSVQVFGPVPPECWVAQVYRTDPERPQFIEMDSVLCTPDGEVRVVVEGYSLRSAAAAGPPGTEPPNTDRRTWSPGIRGRGMLTNDEGVELYRRIISLRPGPQVITSVGSLADRLDESRSFTQESEISAESRPEAVRTAGSFSPPETPMQVELAKLWGDALGLAQIGIDDDFFLLGGSSLTGVQLASRIRARLGVEFSAADLFEYPTIRLLSGLVD